MKSQSKGEAKTLSNKSVARIVSRAVEKEGKLVHLTEGQRKTLRATKRS